MRWTDKNKCIIEWGFNMGLDAFKWGFNMGLDAFKWGFNMGLMDLSSQ